MDKVTRIAKGLTKIQREALKWSVFIAGSWGLTTEYEDHPDIEDDLPEDIACPTSGILTPLGCKVRDFLLTPESDPDANQR